MCKDILGGHQNFIIGLKVTAIFLNRLILPIGRVALAYFSKTKKSNFNLVRFWSLLRVTL